MKNIRICFNTDITTDYALFFGYWDIVFAEPLRVFSRNASFVVEIRELKTHVQIVRVDFLGVRRLELGFRRFERQRRIDYREKRFYPFSVQTDVQLIYAFRVDIR